MIKILLRLLALPVLAILFTLPAVLLLFAVPIVGVAWVLGYKLAMDDIVESPYKFIDIVLEKLK